MPKLGVAGIARRSTLALEVGVLSSSLPLVLYPSTKKMILLLLGSITFVEMGVFISAKEPIVGYLCTTFFGLCAVVAAISLLPGSGYIRITDKGFTFCSLFRKTFVSWQDVQEFMPTLIGRYSMVGWNYSVGFTGRAKIRRIASAVSGVEAALPDTYGMKAVDLAGLLNRKLARYRSDL